MTAIATIINGAAVSWVLGTGGATHRSKITKKVHKPPQNHYIEWPVFSDIGLNCESQGEKGRTCKTQNYN